jgi:hypothetical protein
MEIPQKVKDKLPYDTVITALLGIYSKEHKSRYNRDICTPMFIAVLFTIAKLWKQPRCNVKQLMNGSKEYIYNGVLLSHKE